MSKGIRPVFLVRLRFRPIPLLALIAMTGVLALPSPAAAARCKHTGARPGDASQRALRMATRCLLNKKRRSHGLLRLRGNGRLHNAAGRHTVDMARRHYFSHTSISGASFLDRIRHTGYLRRARRWSVGENIAWGTGALSTPRAIVRAWMRSPGHRANILSPRFREIGIGISFGAPVRSSAHPAATYTTDFGQRN
jgi:uncharacterized protein YkwD